MKPILRLIIFFYFMIMLNLTTKEKCQIFLIFPLLGLDFLFCGFAVPQFFHVQKQNDKSKN
jgi:hypothetical protein